MILEQARKMHAPAFRYDGSMCEIIGKTDKSIDFIFNYRYDERRIASDISGADTSDRYVYRDLQVRVPYLAEYQLVNSALAMIALRVIDPERTIDDELVVQGIGETRWQGRMETVLPGVVFDGAHNADGIREFIRTVQSVNRTRKVSLLFSAVVEKEYEKMIQTICESADLSSVVVTQIDGARVVPAGTLADVFRRYTAAPVTAKADVEEAFDTALEQRGDSMLFCAGSLYLVGELKAILRKRGADITTGNRDR